MTGRGFVPHALKPRALLVGGGVGIPAVVLLAEALCERSDVQWKPLVLLGSQTPFPFHPRPSTILVPGMPAGVIAAVPSLEERGVPSRLATLADFPGCYDGAVTDLAAAWLTSLDRAKLDEMEMFACGPAEMVEAAAAVALRFGIPCQAAPEEVSA